MGGGAHAGPGKRVPVRLAGSRLATRPGGPGYHGISHSLYLTIADPPVV